MLTGLSVRNIVLIDKLDLEFSDGLTVFTGETGAGKSILLDSLALALGVRAETGLVRHGEKEASVTAVFSVPISHSVGALLSSHGYNFSGEVILRRVVSRDGRSRAFVNDEPVSIGFLKSVGDLLVEIHAQFASHKLLNPATHLETLDLYGNLSKLVSDCRHAYNQWQYKKRERVEAERTFIQAKEEETFLKESVSDLEKLNPAPDEEETLIVRRSKLMNSEKIVTALNRAHELLSDEDIGGLKIMGQALSQLEYADNFSDHELSSLVEQFSQSFSIFSDSVSEIEKEQEKWGDISELPMIDDRLFALRDMARKHQVTISQLPDLLQQLKSKLTQLELGETAIDTLRSEEEQGRLNYITIAEKLSKARLDAAIRLDTSVTKELPTLKLNKAEFKTEIIRLTEDEWAEKGMDRVLFLVSTNKGVPLSPIHKIASGGELARFMLALKVNLAAADDIDTLIFDEVDSGIGGGTAAAVGERLRRLAEHHQVLVVTHSPQVAAYAQSHFAISKEEKDQSVLTQVNLLDNIGRQDEIARMLSGEKTTKTAVTMAKELLSTCLKK